MVVVYDIETLKSCFTYTDINIETQEINQFVIHKDRDDTHKLKEHLLKLTYQIGFNNINFDYPIIHYFLSILVNDYSYPENTIHHLYTKAQDIIESQNKDQFFNIVAIKEDEVLIKQLDLFKIWHFNNMARSTSLKALEISMNYPNVMEMPISHTKEDITIEEVSGILEYNLNDVLATFEFYKRSKDKIELRKSLLKKYNIPCLNFSDTKIGEQLILKLYCEKTNSKPWDIKKLRTERYEIKLSDCIFEFIDFKTNKFKDLLLKLKCKSVYPPSTVFKESVIHKGFKYDYGLGGIHGCIKAGVYCSNDEYTIIDADVGSMYPTIAVNNRLYPEHLGEVFCDVYEQEILIPRMIAKKAGDTIMSDGFKLSANSVYGKSNDDNSFLKDPLYTYKTTVNGQLMLTMLCEDLVESINSITVLQVNTDGLTVKIKKSDLDLYYSICKEWEIKTRFTLEYVEYEKMVIRDVNNYSALSKKGKIKYKGAFEIDKDYHKDNSFRIIPYALSEYFFKNIPVETTITNHSNIYDFCGRQKFDKKSYGQTNQLQYDENENPFNKIENQQKNVRYYIKNKGKTFVKRYNKGTSEVINKGFEVEIFNKYVEKNMEEYDINYQFYIKECYKEINQIEDKQLTLF